MKTKLTILALATLAGMALAAPQTFNFKDPKGINNAGFKLDAPLESINGSASGVSGTVIFDPENFTSPSYPDLTSRSAKLGVNLGNLTHASGDGTGHGLHAQRWPSRARSVSQRPSTTKER